MEENNHYFYVVRCCDDSLYAGYSNNVEKRVQAHNNGKGAKYTSGRRPVTLVYKKVFNNKGDALRAEYEFKQWTKKRKEQFLITEMRETYVATKKFP